MNLKCVFVNSLICECVSGICDKGTMVQSTRTKCGVGMTKNSHSRRKGDYILNRGGLSACYKIVWMISVLYDAKLNIFNECGKCQ